MLASPPGSPPEFRRKPPWRLPARGRDPSPERAARAGDRRARKKAEGALRASAAATASSRKGPVTRSWSPTGGAWITLFNAAARQRLRMYTEAEALGQPLALLVPPGDRDARARRGMATRVATSRGEALGRQAGGASGPAKAAARFFPWSCRLTALELPEGVIVLAAIRDATEARQPPPGPASPSAGEAGLAGQSSCQAGVAHRAEQPLSFVLEQPRGPRAATSTTLGRRPTRPPPDGTSSSSSAAPGRGVGRAADAHRAGAPRFLPGSYRAETDLMDIHQAITGQPGVPARAASTASTSRVDRQFGELPPVSQCPGPDESTVLRALE